jgi:ketosteroid isomerase-like protein
MKVLLLLVASATVPPTLPLLGQAGAPALRREVFSAESSFAASMTQRDPKAFAALISPEAIFFGDTTVMRGKAAVVEGWARFFAGPAAPFSWKPDVIEVLASGKLALSSGPVYDPGGRRVGSFNSIWRQEPNGHWRIIFDKGCS